MISFRFRIIVYAICLVYFFFVGLCLKKRYFKLRYALLWLLIGVALLMLAIFPGLLNQVAALMGIYSPTNALFTIFIFCITAVLIMLTIIVSLQSEKIKKLSQALGLLENRVRKIENNSRTEKNADPAFFSSK